MSNTPEFWAKYTKPYDDVIGQFSGHQLLVNKHARALEGQLKVLDSGCHAGRLAGELLERGHRVYGIDINPVALNILKERHCENPNLTVEWGDANDLPYKNGYFDGVSSMLVLWAIEDPLAYLAEQRRVLKPHGTLVLSGPGPDTKERADELVEAIKQDLVTRRLFSQDSWDAFMDYTKQNLSDTVEHWFTHDDIAEVLRTVGFQVDSIRGNPVYSGTGHVVVASKK